MTGDSSIKIRISAFLTQLYPFAYFTKEDLDTIAYKTRISVFKKDQFIYTDNQLTTNYFYLIKKGAVSIEEKGNASSTLVDKCGEGDFFGIKPILAKTNYHQQSRCLEDTILYEIPADTFESIYPRYPEAAKYMVKWLAKDKFDEAKITSLEIDLKTQSYVQVGNTQKIISTASGVTVQSVIEDMSTHNVSSIIVLNNQLPLGIVTDRDIRNMVAKGYNGMTLIDSVMSSPVICIPAGTSLEQAQLSMIESGIHHLCVTEDGTHLSKCVGIVTEHDIMYAGASDPIVILKKIKASSTLSQLKVARGKIDSLIKTLIAEDLIRKTTLSILSQLNQALIQKAITIAFSKLKNKYPHLSESSISFFSMGSAGRGEQILTTDQDNGIIIADEQGEFKRRWLELGSEAIENLKTLGYDYCPAKMMANNPEWCMTVSEYKNKIRNWIMNPGPEEVLKTSIFFDFRHEYGNIDLTTNLKEYIKELLATQDVYLRFLAAQAVRNPPPTSFFRDFVVEKNGDHQDLFDIKLRAISPIVDSARVLSLQGGYMTTSNTVKRLEFMKKEDDNNAILYDDALESFLELLTIKTAHALKHIQQGRYIDPKELNKLQRIKLRSCFNPARKLLSMIERNYQLAYLR